MVIIIIPASKTPASTAIVPFLALIPSKQAARLPVQAPVPGRGMPTKSVSAKNKPKPALFSSFSPALYPLSRKKVKIFPI